MEQISNCAQGRTDVKNFQNLAENKEQTLAKLLHSFRNFPPEVPVCKHRLAFSGFRFFGDKDRVVCESCKVEVQNWKSGDDGDLKKFHKNDCRFCLHSNQPNVPTGGEVMMKGLSNKPRQTESKIQTFSSFRLPLSQPEQRRQTFYLHIDNWRSAYKHKLGIEDLVIAGFYYTGNRDCVKCFSCNKKVYDWKEEDNDAWKIHKLFSPSCYHIQNHVNQNPASRHRHDIAFAQRAYGDLPYSISPTSSCFDVADHCSTSQQPQV